MLHYHFSHNGMLPITKVIPCDNNDKAAAATATGSSTRTSYANLNYAIAFLYSSSENPMEDTSWRYRQFSATMRQIYNHNIPKPKGLEPNQ